MIFKKVLREVRSVVDADNIILYFPDVKAKDHRVNLHVSDMRMNGIIGTDEVGRSPYNLGDFLGNVIVNWMLAKKGLSLDDYVLQKQHLLTVGSGAVKSYQNMTMWGAGVERELPQMVRRFFLKSWFRKLDIRAVRGPMSRDYLIRLGHKCPEVYGDPAILMPLIYAGQGEKKYDFSIIPQLVTEKGVREKYPDAHIISMNTDDYKGVIDQIVQSRLIVSSSLHGVILADVYGVPSVWYRGLGKEIDFKYKDYYASTGRYVEWIPTCVEEALQCNPLPLPDLKLLQEGLLSTFPYDLWDK
jgi:pyruvyltransferase